MEAFSLMATIALNSKGFESALKGAGEGVAGLAKRLVSTQLVLKGVEAGFGAIKKVVSGGIDAFAEYQQLVGGVETLFGGAANQVQQYANIAYKTAGLSANQYMQTVTSFSASLMQGLKGDTEKAAEIANTAVIDMSDNANKMGTDMQSIQNAYMGFAKGNFTMLDNLKLGYGGTKTEMVRLINDSGVMEKKIKSIDEVSFADMIKAIHAIQQEMGITGTTAEEAAGTISGSQGSLYAAFQNLLTFATDGTQPEQLQKAQDAFVSSFAAYFNNNLSSKIVSGIKGSEEVFSAIASAILTIPKDTAGNFLSAGLLAGGGLLNSLSDITGWLFEQISGALTNPEVTEENSTAFGESLGNFIGTFIREGITHLPEIIPGLLTLGLNLAQGLLQGLSAGLFGTDGIREELGQIDDETEEALKEADENWLQASVLIDWLDDLKSKYGEAAESMPEWQEAMQGLIDLAPEWKQFFDTETNGMKESTDAMRDYNKAQRDVAIEAARRIALQAKQDLVDKLRGERANAEGTIAFETSRSETIADDTLSIVNRVLKANGIDATLSGSTGADVAALIETLSNMGLADKSAAEGWRIKGTLGVTELSNLLDWFHEVLDFETSSIEGENGEKIDIDALLETRANLYEESQKAITEAQKVVDKTKEELAVAEEDLRLSNEAFNREFGVTETPTEEPQEKPKPDASNWKVVDYKGEEIDLKDAWNPLGGLDDDSFDSAFEEAEAMAEQTRNSGAVRESVDQMTTSQQTEAAKTREVMNSAQAASDATVEAVEGLGDRIEEAAANGVSRGMDGMTVNMDGQKVGEISSGYQADRARTHQYDGGEP